MKYYAQYEEAPNFYTFDDIDTNKLDLSIIAKHIVDSGMNRTQEKEYKDELWNSSDDK